MSPWKGKEAYRSLDGKKYWKWSNLSHPEQGSPNQQTPSLKKERFTKQVKTHGNSFPTKFTWILETTVQARG